MNNQMIHYHMHSDYSLLDSCTQFSDYIQLAKEYGETAIASTEHGRPMGWTKKKMLCDEAGIKFIHGVEIYLTESLTDTEGKKIRDNYHTILLARNYDGVKELNKLVSLSTMPDHFYYVNRITFDEFLNISDNIISTSACLASPLHKLPIDHPMYEKLAIKLGFYELQPHMDEEQLKYNRFLMDLSRQFNKPLILGTDTHSSNEYKAKCRQILLESKRKSYPDDHFDLVFHDFSTIKLGFNRLDNLHYDEYAAALDNTNLLNEMCDDISLDKSIKYPILYGSREKDAEMFNKNVDERFKDKVAKGIIPPEQVDNFKTAIAEEKRVFRKLNMEGFMLSMSEIISWCKEQGFAIGTARGSVGGSRVAYVTDIIDLNPEQWHTVFSRFANESRVEVGDIDIDCVASDRPKIFEYITERFGREKTARVAAYGTLQEKNSIEDICRALNTRWLNEHSGEGESPYSLRNVDIIKEEYDKDPERTKKKYKDVFYYQDGLMNTKISQSVHPAGMVIAPINLIEEYGVFEKDGELCLTMDMDEAHDVGAVKYDMLVLRTVEIINDTCKNIGIKYPRTHEIDWEDQAVWEDMLKCPYGVFQFEGDFAFTALKKFQPHSIYDMSLVTASIRPSGASYRKDLLAHKIHKNPSKMIDDLLSDSLCYLIYQEQTIKFLQEICGLSGSEADNIRRAIGHKDFDRLNKALPDILNGYCEKSTQPREIAEQEAKEFLQIIEDSASYQFG